MKDMIVLADVVAYTARDSSGKKEAIVNDKKREREIVSLLGSKNQLYIYRISFKPCNIVKVIKRIQGMKG
jgi:hypothetical protein